MRPQEDVIEDQQYIEAMIVFSEAYEHYADCPKCGKQMDFVWQRIRYTRPREGIYLQPTLQCQECHIVANIQ
jgi:uncharacterized Zn finger protein